MTTRLQQDAARLVLGAALLLIACDETGLPLPGPNPPLPTICEASVVVMVKNTEVPEFSWTPNCRVVKAIIETASTGSDRWVIVLAAGFNGPLKYGDVPPGATVVTAAQPLVRGTEYHFVMFGDVEETRLIGVGVLTR
jgi:hypothetical protein